VITAFALAKVAAQLERASRNAAFGGHGTGVLVKDPKFLVALLRRAGRELDQ
jgi:hypothetical protein